MLLAIPFLLVVALVLPALALFGLRQSQNQAAGQYQDLPLTPVIIQIGVVQTIVAALAWLAMWGNGLEISWGAEISPFTFAVAWLTLGVIVTVAFFEARRPLKPEEVVRRRLRKISAGNEAWMGITIYAGMVEEFAYRGVLTLILASFMGYWPGAVISAILFSLSHIYSGKRAVLFGIPFALAMQGLVYISGGLLLAILVHAIYDLVAAWLGHRMPIREAQPTPE